MDALYVQRMIPPPKQSFFLFGPRGSGKTTWVRHQYPKAHSINLLDEALYLSYVTDISLFAAELRALPPQTWVFVDEVQRLPNLLNEVHRFIEERGLKFILTGSSARKLKQTGVNLLAGRALYKKMFPFLPWEIGDGFQLDQALRTGCLPLVWNAEDKKETLKAYIQMYLKEEIKAEALVRNLPGFARFLPIAALMHGQAVNLSNAARETGISRTTVSGYMEILEDTLLVFRMPAYSAKMRLRERKHPKLYWVDAGMVRGVRNRFGELYPEESGALFEGMVAVILKTYQQYMDLFDELYYWAPAPPSGIEVDFLLKKDEKFIAVEVKSAGQLRKEHLKGLKAIKGLPGLLRRILVYRGEKTLQTEEGIDVLPFMEFNGMLSQNRLWP